MTSFSTAGSCDPTTVGIIGIKSVKGLAALSVAFDPYDPQNTIAEIIAPSINLFVSRVVFSTDGGKHWMTATRNGIALEANSESKMKQLAIRVKEAA